MSRVGVVIPVYGWAPYLPEAIDSVLAEGADPVVVVDDGSPEPVALVPGHAARVTLLRRDVNGGSAAARDSGVAALGDVDLVAFCDADDAWEPGSLAPRVAAFADPEVAGAFGRALVVGPDGRPTGERWAEPPSGPLDPAALFASNPVPTSSVVLRRAAYGGFDSRFVPAEDWDLWLRTAGAGRFVCVPEARVRYRRHAGGQTASVAKTARATIAVREAHAGLVAPREAARLAAGDRAALAAGLVRERDYAGARRLLPWGARRVALGVPGLRALAGRRDPYRA